MRQNVTVFPPLLGILPIITHYHHRRPEKKKKKLSSPNAKAHGISHSRFGFSIPFFRYTNPTSPCRKTDTASLCIPVSAYKQHFESKRRLGNDCTEREQALEEGLFFNCMRKDWTMDREQEDEHPQKDYNAKDDMNNKKAKLSSVGGKGEERVLPPPFSPSEETTACSSSMETINSTTALTHHRAESIERGTEPHDLQLRNLSNQILHLSIASGASLIMLIVATIPMSLLVGVSVVTGVWMALLYKVYQRIVWSFNRRLETRGFGDYLPESIYNQLVHMTLHEWLTDASFMQEYGYLMLYFIPGVTPDQLQSYIDRLVPRHQQLLRQRGLGHLLGPEFMRFLLGDDGQSSPAQSARLLSIPEQPHLPAVGTSSSSSVDSQLPRRLQFSEPSSAVDDDEDNASDFDLNDAADHPADQYLRFFGLEPAVDDDHQDRPSRSHSLLPPPATVPSARAVTTTTNAKNEDKDLQEDVHPLVHGP